MRSAATILGALLALAMPLAAQDAAPPPAQAPAPALRGTLRDSTGRPLVGVDVSYERVKTRTDSLGNFRLTPVPTGRITVRFALGRALIGEVEANVTTDTTTGVAVEVLSDRSEPRSFTGVVVDSSGAPVKGVMVEVVTAMVDQRTDSLGRFAFRNLPASRHFVRVRRVGYPPTYVGVDLTDSVSRRARIVVRQYAGQNLGLVVVRADRVQGRMRGFLDRAEKKSGWGKIFTAEDIARRNPIRATDMLQGLAGVRVNQDRFGRGIITGRGNCIMAVYINGFPAPQRGGSGIDDLVSSLDLAGIEVYNGIGGVPSDLMMGPPNSCGTIGIWTK
jgi:hypothetical protein